MSGFLGHVVRGRLDPRLSADAKVVEPGVEFGSELTWFDPVTVDLDTDSITFLNSSNSGSLGWLGFTFRFTDRYGAIPDIVGASVASQSGALIIGQLGFMTDEVSLALGRLLLGPSGSFAIDVDFAPEPLDDSLSGIVENSRAQTITTLAALLANDTDADLDEGETLAITGISDAVGGTAQIVDTDVLFTAAANFAGTASFTVQNVLQPPVHAGNGNNTVNGTNDADQLFGDNGNDLLLGLGDNDVLDGGRGDDTLDGGAGSDRMTGGAGLDRFAFGLGAGQYPDGSSNTARNVITDYAGGTDRFLIDSSETGANDFAGDILVPRSAVMCG